VVSSGQDASTVSQAFGVTRLGIEPSQPVQRCRLLEVAQDCKSCTFYGDIFGKYDLTHERAESDAVHEKLNVQPCMFQKNS